MNIQNLPDVIKEFGFNKTISAIQNLYDSELITESDARRLMKHTRALYIQQFTGDYDSVNTNQYGYFYLNYDDNHILNKALNIKLH